jgi:hypothetical protein
LLHRSVAQHGQCPLRRIPARRHRRRSRANGTKDGGEPRWVGDFVDAWPEQQRHHGSGAFLPGVVAGENTSAQAC